MDGLDQIWETSRVNRWSIAYPVVVILGTAVLIALSYLKNRLTRQVLVLALVPGLTLIAAEASAMAISEKWRIRQAWTIEHSAELTEQQRQFAFGDGGNLLFGPLEPTALAFIIYVGTAMIGPKFISLCRRKSRPLSPTLAS